MDSIGCHMQLKKGRELLVSLLNNDFPVKTYTSMCQHQIVTVKIYAIEVTTMHITGIGKWYSK